MGALTWLKLSRSFPGLNRQPAYPNLEALLETESEKISDGFHYARWVVPLVLTVVGLSVFLPLTLVESPYFLIGAIGMPFLGGVLGFIFHRVALGIPDSRLALRKRSKLLAGRMLRLKNLLGIEPTLAPSVGKVLDDAAAQYFALCGHPGGTGRNAATMLSQTRERSEEAMEAAMAQMLELAEPDSVAAQEIKLSQGWALPLLKEMRALNEAVRRQEHQAGQELLEGQGMEALAALRSARTDIERIEEALDELHTGQSA